MEVTCTCESLIELSPGVFICGWCKQCYDADGNRVERPVVVDEPMPDLRHLDRLTLGAMGVMNAE